MSRRLWVERNEDGTWEAHSDDGVSLKFGHGEGMFNPVELMQIALAGCTALSSQYAAEHAIGEGAGARVVVNGTYDAEEGAYLRFQSAWNATFPGVVLLSIRSKKARKLA